MKVLALVPYPVGIAPSQRYRFEQWAPHLRTEGIELDFLPFVTPGLSRILYEPGRYLAKAWHVSHGLGRRLRDAWSARRYDLVLVQREASLVGPAWAERLARRRRPAFVYDLDDAVYLPYNSPTHGSLAYLKFPGKTASLCHMASAVMAGNSVLADYASRYNPRVEIVPSTIDLDVYRPHPGAPPGRMPVIGWTGSHSSAQYLPMVFGALRRLRARREFKVLVIGVEGLQVPGVETECRPWSAAREVADLWDMDVGIMPLPDEPWARGKCAMKAIQYMGVGIPAVASPVGANRDVITPGVTGFLPEGDDEWVDTLDQLLADRELRTGLGSAARRDAQARFSAQAKAPRVAALFRSVAA
jgi:glycosyltransferase involved in cell wall biosynthesis